MKKVLKQHKLIVCLLLTAVSLVFTFTVFSGVFSAIGKAASELASSFVAYIQFIIFLKLPTKIPTNAPTGEIEDILPTNPNQFGSDTANFWQALWSGENFSNYMIGVENVLIAICRILPIVILLIVVLRKFIKNAFNKHNNNYNKDTKILRAFKWTSKIIYQPPKRYIASLLDYIKQSSFPKVWLLIWLFNFNGLAVLMSVISICLYFFISFDFVALYHFFYNLIVLLMPMFKFIPVWLWIVLVLVLVDRWRKKRALSRLRYMESQNKEFILDRSICTMFVGTMGKGKTTLMTDITLSTEAIFRSKAKELMLDIDLKFPQFPYIVLENELKSELDKGNIFNLASCSLWIEQKRIEFEKAQTTENVWTYAFERYGLTYDDKKTTTTLFEALKDYVKLYFIYITHK